MQEADLISSISSSDHLSVSRTIEAVSHEIEQKHWLAFIYIAIIKIARAPVLQWAGHPLVAGTIFSTNTNLII